MTPMPKLLQIELILFAILGGGWLVQQQIETQAQSKKPPLPSAAVKAKPATVPSKSPSLITPAASLKPVPGKAAALTASDPIFVGAGDIAECSKPEDELTAQLIDKIPGTVFTAGDNAYPNGTAEDFQKCYDPTWGRFKARTYPTPGNHEYNSPNGDPYYAYFGARSGAVGKGYYSYELGEWHIVALNSNIDAQTGSEQERWLKADLAAHPKACTLAYWHHPVFSSGLHGNNPKMKDIWQTLYDAGVDVVVNGHDHQYERFAAQNPEGKAEPKRGIREFVVGTGGAELRELATVRPNSEVQNTATYGVIKFVLQPKSYSWQFIPIPGKTFTDKGTQACVSAS